MDLSWSLDDVVRTSDEDVVRRRFAQRNRAWLTFLLIFFAFATFIAVVDHSIHKTVLDVLIGVANLALIAAGLFVMRYASREALVPDRFLVRAGAWLRRHTNAVALVYVAVQFLLCLVLSRHTDDFLGWVMTFPLLMLGFRMLVPELVLLHVYLLTGGLLMTLTGGQPARKVPIYVSMIVINALALSFERSEEHTSELQSRLHLVCRLLLEKKNTNLTSQC